jgi:hypothetical protein
MIRPFTLITAMLAAMSGAYLFGVKHRAQVLDDQLAAVAQNSRLDQQRIRVLQAQWALEIDPNRLQQLAGAFTGLQPMKPVQLVTLADLRAMLPPAGSAAPGANPASPAPADIASLPSPASVDADAAVADAASSGVAPPAGVSLLPMPPPPMPPRVVLASVTPPPVAARASAHVSAKPRRVAARPVTHDNSSLGDAQFAANLPPPRPLYTPSVASPPMGARVVSVSAAPMADQNGGSLLGMAADMAPPGPQGIGN